MFNLQNEKWKALGENGWTSFVAAVTAILTAVGIVWINPTTGYSDALIQYLEHNQSWNLDAHGVTLFLGVLFPLVHSGMASLRPHMEPMVGARTWRVLFAFPSLCLSYTWIAYYIAHAHDGAQYFHYATNPTLHTVCWTLNLISFFFLYPTVFHLKEVAAVDKPKYHLWETGVMRITRHPQFIGQCLWSTGHFIMIGSSFTLLTMALLVGHHGFAC